MKNLSKCLNYEDCFETLAEARAEIKRLREFPRQSATQLQTIGEREARIRELEGALRDLYANFGDEADPRWERAKMVFENNSNAKNAH